MAANQAKREKTRREVVFRVFIHFLGDGGGCL